MNNSPHVETLSDFALDLEKIEREVQMLPMSDHQIYLQGTHEGMDPIEPTRGSNYLQVDKNELAYSVPLFPMPYINSLMEHYDLVRTRVMMMKPRMCYSYHKDRTKRLHIPLVTNPHCFLVVETEAIHLPRGGMYIVDTTKMHTAFNAWDRVRVHIVGALKS